MVPAYGKPHATVRMRIREKKFSLWERLAHTTCSSDVHLNNSLHKVYKYYRLVNVLAYGVLV